MIDDAIAAVSLDRQPAGARVAASFIPEDDDTSSVILFERRLHEGEWRWCDMTRREAWWTSREIALAFDDMVIVHLPVSPAQERIAQAADAIQERARWRSIHWPSLDALQHRDVALAIAAAALTAVPVSADSGTGGNS